MKNIDLDSIRGMDQNFFSKSLGNGIRFCHVPTKSSYFYFSVTFKTGTRNEMKYRSGVSHFLEHMMFRGSKNYSSFIKLAEAFEWLGGEWNAETGYEHTEYSYNGHGKNAAEVIRLFSEFIKTPLLLDIELEREVILREIEDELNEFGFSTDMDWHMSNLFWPNSSMSLPITGTQLSVESTTQKDLDQYRQDFYTPENMTICVVGGGDSENLFQKISGEFETYTTSKSVQKTDCSLKPFQGPKVEFVKNSDNQHHLQLSFLTEGEWSDKTFCYEIISRVLSDGFSSRLPMKLREELGLVYDVDTDCNLFSDAGSFDISTSITPEKLPFLLKEVLKVLQDLKNDGATDRELEKFKTRAILDICLMEEDLDELVFRNAWFHIHGKDPSLEKCIQKILSISADDIKLVANEVFQRSNLGIVVLGDEETELLPLLYKVVQDNL